MSAGWVPNSMATIIRRRITALEGSAVELFRQEENPDDCNELLKALSEIRALREALGGIADGLDAPGA